LIDVLELRRAEIADRHLELAFNLTTGVFQLRNSTSAPSTWRLFLAQM